jgi:hypothetical protein
VARQEELNNFKHNEVWSLVERPKQNVVGSKGYSAANNMNMELLLGTKHDSWKRLFKSQKFGF